MDKEEFSFDKLPDLVTPQDLKKAGYPEGENAIYELFKRPDFPAIVHGRRKLLISKAALMKYFQAQ